jgi:uncharacterized protein (TIGR00369 family)
MARSGELMKDNEPGFRIADPASYIEAFRRHDKLGSLLGAKITAISGEECLSEYEVNPAHFNPNQILHGGALYSVMDSSQGAFVHFILESQFRHAATGTATIRYEAPLRSGIVRIRTWLKSRERRKLFVISEARGEDGKLVAALEEIWIAIA